MLLNPKVNGQWMHSLKKSKSITTFGLHLAILTCFGRDQADREAKYSRNCTFFFSLAASCAQSAFHSPRSFCYCSCWYGSKTTGVMLLCMTDELFSQHMRGKVGVKTAGIPRYFFALASHRVLDLCSFKDFQCICG